MEFGSVYWITGLAGAGKTTLGKLLYEKIRQQKSNVLLLDGDIARWAYNDAIGYSRSAREEGAYRNARVCKMISDQGVDVICCTVSMFHGVREWNRENITRYREIFLDVPLEVLKFRDQKGLYSQFLCGLRKDVMGMDLQMEIPRSPDLRIINDGSRAPHEVLKIICDKFLGK